MQKALNFVSGPPYITFQWDGPDGYPIVPENIPFPFISISERDENDQNLNNSNYFRMGWDTSISDVLPPTPSQYPCSCPDGTQDCIASYVADDWDTCADCDSFECGNQMGCDGCVADYGQTSFNWTENNTGLPGLEETQLLNGHIYRFVWPPNYSESMLNVMLPNGVWEYPDSDTSSDDHVILWGQSIDVSATWLDLSNKQLTGEIPPEIGNLTDLVFLSLSTNQLTGEIPSSIGNLTNLNILRLNLNQLTGEIPPEIGNLEVLARLDLDSNQLTGEIPPEIGNLNSPGGMGTGLQELNLQHNQLTGEIPPEIGNLTSLTDLRLFGNQLTGIIPGALVKNNLNITHLQLEGNKFVGIEPSICDGNPDFWNQIASQGNGHDGIGLYIGRNFICGEFQEDIPQCVLDIPDTQYAPQMQNCFLHFPWGYYLDNMLGQGYRCDNPCPPGTFMEGQCVGPETNYNQCGCGASQSIEPLYLCPNGQYSCNDLCSTAEANYNVYVDGDYGAGLTVIEMIEILHSNSGCGWNENCDKCVRALGPEHELSLYCSEGNGYRYNSYADLKWDDGEGGILEPNDGLYMLGGFDSDGNLIGHGFQEYEFYGYRDPGYGPNQYCKAEQFSLPGAGCMGDARPYELLKRVYEEIAINGHTAYWPIANHFPYFGADISMNNIQYYGDYDINNDFVLDNKDAILWHESGRHDMAILVNNIADGTIDAPPFAPWAQPYCDHGITFNNEIPLSHDEPLIQTTSEAHAWAYAHFDDLAPDPGYYLTSMHCSIGPSNTSNIDFNYAICCPNGYGSDGGPGQSPCQVNPGGTVELVLLRDPYTDITYFNSYEDACANLTNVDATPEVPDIDLGFMKEFYSEDPNLTNPYEGFDQFTTSQLTQVNYFSGNNSPTLVGSDIFTASMDDTNKKYYFGITDGNPNSSKSNTQFHVAFGHYAGSGSNTYNDTIKGESEAVYKQYSSLLSDEPNLGFFISSGSDVTDNGKRGNKDEFIYVLNFKQSNFKDQLQVGNWVLNISGSQSSGSGFHLHLTDDSKQNPSNNYGVGRVYNIVSGSEGNLIQHLNSNRFGLFYADMGIMVLGEAIANKFRSVTSPTAGVFNNKDYIQLAGSITASNASNQILGSGTNFITDLNIGDDIQIKSGSDVDETVSQRFTVAHISSSTSMSLSSNWTGVSFTGSFAFKNSGYNQMYPLLSSSADGNNALRLVNTMKNVNGTAITLYGEKETTDKYYACRVQPEEFNFTNNPTIISSSTRNMSSHPPNQINQFLTVDGTGTMTGNPHAYINMVNLLDNVGNCIASATLSTPIQNNFEKEVVIKVKLSY